MRASALRDGTAVAALRASFSELSVPDAALSDEAWETVQRLNDISTVAKRATRDDADRKHRRTARTRHAVEKMDLSQLDLANLGERVLSNCTETDMSQFAGSIDSLPSRRAIHQSATGPGWHDALHHADAGREQLGPGEHGDDDGDGDRCRKVERLVE